MDEQKNSDIPADDILDFTDRELILERFEQILHSAVPGRFRVLAVKGNSGTGKTTLIRYLEEQICPQRSWQSGTIRFGKSIPTFRFILDELAGELAKCVTSSAIQEYREKRDTHIKSYQSQLKPTVNASQSMDARDHSSVNTASQNMQVDFAEHEQELQHRSNLTNALIELAERSEKPLCIFVDSYHRLQESNDELVDWFWKDVLLGFAKSSPQPIVIMTCGWDYPSISSIAPYTISMPPLEDFDRLQVQNYLEKHTIPFGDQQNELTDAFYTLTRGHPLVLSLAVTYFQTLPPDRQEVSMLYSPGVLENIEAQTRFIQERLLSYLLLPYLTLLQYGPVLRMFDQKALQALLEVEIVGEQHYQQDLDNETYDRFLRYPFITKVSNNQFNGQRTFHDLVRSVQLDSLRTHHRPTLEQLHIAMADYYLQIANDEIDKASEQEKTSSASIIPRIVIPELAFTAYLEHVYHALQVPEKREQTFEEWYFLTQAIIYAHCQQATELLEAMRQHVEKSGQAEALLNVVQQLIDEGEEFFQEKNDYYGHYMMLYSRFLDQEGRWKEAQDKAEQAIEIFQQTSNATYKALCLNNLGLVHRTHGETEIGVKQLESALAILRQEENAGATALVLNNLAVFYQEMNLHEQSLRCLREALPIIGEVRDPINFALALNNMGISYQTLGNLDQALIYFRRAMQAAEAINDGFHYAVFIVNIGGIYQQEGRLALALEQYEYALPWNEQVGNVTNIALVLGNMGRVYELMEKWGQALLYYEKALPFYEKTDNIRNIAATITKIAAMHYKMGNLEQALKRLEELRTLCEENHSDGNLATTLTSIGNIYQEQGQLELALQQYKRAVPLFDEQEDASGKINALCALGSLYLEKKQWQQAVTYFEEALLLCERSNDTQQKRSILLETGKIYLQQKEWTQALKHYEQALPLLEQQTQATQELVSVLNTIGALCTRLHTWPVAFAWHEHALRLSEQQHDTAGIALSFYSLGEHFCARGQWELALSYHKQALALRDQDNSIHSLNRIGFIYSIQESWKESLRCYERARELAQNEKYRNVRALFLTAISSVYYAQGNRERALHYCELALELQSNQADMKRESIPVDWLAPLNNRGEIYHSLGRLEEALQDHQQALTQHKQANNQMGIAISLNNIAGCYYTQGDMTQAFECSQQALRACEDAADLFILATCLNTMGSIYRAQERIKPALRHYERAYKLFEEIGAPRYAAVTAHNLGIVFHQQQQTQLAIERHQRALDLYERLGHIADTTAIQELELLAQRYTQLGEVEKGARYLERADYLKDKLPSSSENSVQVHVSILVQNSAVPFSFTDTTTSTLYVTWTAYIEPESNIKAFDN